LNTELTDTGGINAAGVVSSTQFQTPSATIGLLTLPNQTSVLLYGTSTGAVTGLTIGSGLTASGTTLSANSVGFFQNATATTAATTINWNNGNKQGLVLGTSTVISFSNVQAGTSYTLWLMQDGTGNRTSTWPTSGTGRVNWPGGIGPILSTGANAMDAISFQCFTPRVTSTLSCYGEYGANNFTQ